MKKELSFNTSLLLTAEEMNAEYKRRELAGIHHPFYFKISGEDKILFYIGSQHVSDPSHHQFPLIEDWWQEFIADSIEGKRIAFIEGGVRNPTNLTSRDQSIKHSGEGGLTQFLALRDSVECISPEPDRVLERDYLTALFPKEDVAYYYFGRLVHAWQRNSPEQSLGEYWDRYVYNNSRNMDTDFFDYSFAHMISLHNEKYDHEFDPKGECFKKVSSPFHNPVAEECSRFRDIHIIEEILKNWNSGKSIFVVYGSGHLVKQQKVLETLLK